MLCPGVNFCFSFIEKGPFYNIYENISALVPFTIEINISFKENGIRKYDIYFSFNGKQLYFI